MLKTAQQLQDKQTKQQDRLLDKIEDQNEEKVALRLSNNDIELDELQELLHGRTNPETGDYEKIGRSYFDTSVKRLSQLDNDPKISDSEKARVYSELLTEFIDFTPRKQKTGFTTFGVTQNEDLETLRAFREKVIKNASFLTQQQTNMFLGATQANFSKALKARVGGLSFIVEVAKLLGGGGVTQAFKIAELATRYMERTNNEGVTPKEAIAIAKDIVDEDVVATHPKTMSYEAGKVYAGKDGKKYLAVKDPVEGIKLQEQP